MTKLKCLVCLLCGTGLVPAAPLCAQFVEIFTPDSSASFHTVSGAENSTGNTGAAVSGEFQWDSEHFYLRVIVNNLSPADGGVLTGFGFTTPTLLANAVQLVDFSSGMNFSVEQPYPNPADAGVYDMSVGAKAANPAPSSGVQPGATGFFDFDFSTAFADPAAIAFSYEGFGFSGGPDGPFSASFRVQSIGLEPEDESDKFGGYVTADFRIPENEIAVPEPSAYGLAGVALLGLLALSRRYRRQA